jgi:hypothetical protein
MKNFTISVLMITAFCINQNVLLAATENQFIVTNTADIGPGSLRQAILDAEAHAGPDTVLFNIPDNDTGYDGNNGVWTIPSVAECYRFKIGETVIDGSSQTINQGDRNSLGPEIAIDGRLLSVSPNNCFLITSRKNAISGLVLFGFKSNAINIGENGANNHIFGNYIGTNATGNDIIRNEYGIQISQGASNNIIGGSKANERNVISGSNSGIILTETTNNIIQGNLIGTDATGTFALGHDHSGITISSGAINNIIGGIAEGEGNLISGNGWYGVSIEYEDSDSNQVIGNKIGTDISGTRSIPNLNSGVRVSGDAQYNQIGPGNLIRHNLEYGLEIIHANALYNRITQNMIYDNQIGGIMLRDGGNSELPAPVITSINPVAGTASPFAIVEIFSDSSDQGRIYEGSAVADGNGDFSWTGTPSGPSITATATDQLGNTSKFSSSYIVSVIADHQLTVPAEYSLMQNYPNPFNPATTISFELPIRVQVTLKVYDALGREVSVLLNEVKDSGRYDVQFDAKNIANGIYLYKLQAGDFAAVKKIIILK